MLGGPRKCFVKLQLLLVAVAAPSRSSQQAARVILNPSGAGSKSSAAIIDADMQRRRQVKKCGVDRWRAHSVLSRPPSIGGGIKTAGGSTVGNETETPKASRGGEWGGEWGGLERGIPPPQPTRRSGGASSAPPLGELMTLPQRGPGQSPGQKRIWCTLELSESH